MKKVLITGKNGQLASELRNILEPISQLDCFFLGKKELPLDQTFIIQDILNMYQPDYIIHTAAYTAVDQAESETELALRINYLASEQIAEYCYTNRCKLITVSTDYVFDGDSSQPINENAEPNPLNVYGTSKWRGEQAIQHFCPDAVIVRTSWLYSKYGNNFVKTMLRLMSERDEISVVNDQIGSPTYAKDLADFLISLLQLEYWPAGIYHFANEGETNWFEFACAIREIKDFKTTIRPLSSSQYPTAAKRPLYSVLDSSKIKETFGLTIPNWKDSLKAMLSQTSDELAQS